MLKYFPWIYDHYRRNLIILQESIFCSISYFYLMRFCRKKKHCKFRNLWQIKQCNLESVLNNTFEEYLGPSVFFSYKGKRKNCFGQKRFRKFTRKRRPTKVSPHKNLLKLISWNLFYLGPGTNSPLLDFC